MNETAKKLREAAAYMKGEGVISAEAIYKVRDALGVSRSQSLKADLGAVLEIIADEMDALQAKAAEAHNLRQQLDSAEKKAERRKTHIGYLNDAMRVKNTLLDKRGGTIFRLTQENSHLRRQVPTERERQILALWPRFEDGEYVWFGDEFLCRCGKSHVCDGVRVQNTGAKVIFAANHPHTIFLKDGSEYSERVKRPVQSVLDADGVEIEVGDNLYDTYTGCMRTVRAINANGTIEFEGHDNRGWFTKFLTHRAPVLAADGLPLREGETVWHEDGSEWLVEEMNRYGARCFDGDKRRTFNQKYLTHTRPKVLDADGVPIRKGDTVWFKGKPTEYKVAVVLDGTVYLTYKNRNGDNATATTLTRNLTHTRPDSWERLEEDVNTIVTGSGMYHRLNDYCNARDLGGDDVMVLTVCDIVRRAKKLAGVEVGR